MLARSVRSLRGLSPPAAAGGAYFEAIAWPDLDAGFLGAQHARLAAFRQQAVVMRRAVLAAQHSAWTIAHAVARGVAARGLFDLHHQIERDAEPAAKLAVAAGVGAEFVMAEIQGKAHFGDLDAAELDAAGGCHSPIDE